MRSLAPCLAGALIVVSAVSSSPPAAAQTAAVSPSVQPSDMPVARSANPGFLIGRPRAFIGLRGNWMFASAGSDIFDFVTTHLTLDRRDFDTRTISPELGITLTQRLDVVLGFEMSSAKLPSEYRDFVDNSLQPINQTTTLSELDVTASIRYAVTPTGRRVSRFAWIPATLVPYVGAGGGATRYRFRQQGDFVDFQDLSVFFSRFESEGWTPSAHVFGGVDVQLYQRLYLSAQARYVWASASLGSDFVSFAPIDLGGFRVGAGAKVVF